MLGVESLLSKIHMDQFICYSSSDSNLVSKYDAVVGKRSGKVTNDIFRSRRIVYIILFLLSCVDY